jgi:5-methylcytosine-specific restriction endonuclease McrA
MKKADELFSKHVRARDGACLNCGSTAFLQCAHIHSRSYKAIRVNPDNAVALCRSCHLKFTRWPLEWEAWVESRFPGRWDELKREALSYSRVDWKFEVERLNEMLRAVVS